MRYRKRKKAAAQVMVMTVAVVAVLAVFIMVGIMVAIIGCLLERAAYRPLRKAGRLSAVVSALGASIFFQNAVMLVYGARFYVYPDWLRPDFTVDLFGIAVPGVRLMVIAASVILMLALWAFIQRTRIGAAVRAVAIDQGAARLMGINVDRIISLVFFIGPGLGGAAGLMVGIYYGQIDFTMGWSYGLKAFTAAILGGIGNIPGAMIGGLLLGSVVASTDAASVFSVLREHNLSLRGGTDSLLEVESGSNDPVAYMLTAVLATLAAGGDINIPALLTKQIILGVGLGLAIGWAAGRLIERAHATAKDAQTIFLFAVAIVAYALPSYLGGNGFLAVYLAGIVLGASDITGKVELAHFFDTLTEMAEMTIFFLLGLLVTPARLPQMLLPGLALMAFMLFVSRPIAVGLLLAPFKTNPRQVALVSWAGLRGAASVVFSLFAVVAGVPGGHDLFDLVFVIAVSSIVVQGSLLPAVAKKLDMIDAAGDVRRTFNDYRDEDGMSFVKFKVGAGHPFSGRSLADIGSATDMLVVLVLRDGAHPVLPNGDTVIEEGDLLVMAAPTFEERAEVTLREVTVTPHGRLAGQRLRDVPQGKHPFIVVMLKREGQTIIPDGNTLIYAGDEAVIATLAS